MKTIRNLTISLCLLAGFASAESWNAKLLDASCADKNGGSGQVDKKSRESLAKMCAAGSGTTMFAFLTSAGKIYKLDDDGNAKAASAYKAGSFKPDNDGDVHATVVGTLQGNTVKVTSISGRGVKGSTKKAA